MVATRRGVTTPGTAAILLAGGRASRLGGAAKPLIEVGGVSLLERTVSAVRAAGCAPIIVAGPESLRDAMATAGVTDAAATRHADSAFDGAVFVREDPPFGGPLAGIAAAVAAARGVGSPDEPPAFMLVLACDMPRVADVVPLLLAAPRGPDGVVIEDASGRIQWLAGLYRTAALTAALNARERDGGTRNAPVRAVLGALTLARVTDPDGRAADVDTWEDVAEAQRAWKEPIAVAEASRTLPPEALDAWAAALRERFDLTADEVPVSLVLDLARDVANDVARPAAPFSAFVAGLVAGKAGATSEDIAAAVSAVTDLARGWEAEGSEA